MRELLFMVMACQENMLIKGDGVNGGNGWPDIEVEPQRLDFGALGPREERTLDFTVRSVGDNGTIVVIDEVTLDVPSNFTLVDDDGVPLDTSTLRLQRGESTVYHVRFAPDAPIVYEAEALVHNNVEHNPAVPVLLEGMGLMPELLITPDPYGFGTVAVGCDKGGEFTLTNVGNAMLEVQGIGVEGDGIALEDDVTVPFMLEPGASRPVDVRFTPAADVDYEGVLVAQSNGVATETQAQWHGAGLVPGEHVDRWALEVDPLVDVLFFVDRSVSMEDDHRALAENFDNFAWSIDDYTPYWRIMVTMPDEGCNEGGIIDHTTEDYAERFTDAVTEDASYTNAYNESGLIVSARAIDRTDAGECNEGFLREGSYLHVILVADEPEQSPDGWATYVDALVAKRGAADHVKISAVAGPYPRGCYTEENSAEAGMGYYEATQATYGVFLELCDSWYENVLALARATVRRSTFPLSHEPDPASIVVRVNGEEPRPPVWSYRGDWNAVVFTDGDEPHEGDDVEIAYRDPTYCDE